MFIGIKNNERNGDKLNSAVNLNDLRQNQVVEIFRNKYRNNSVGSQSKSIIVEEFAEQNKKFEDIWQYENDAQDDKVVNLLYQKRNINEIISLIFVFNAMVSGVFYHYIKYTINPNCTEVFSTLDTNTISLYRSSYITALLIVSLSNIIYIITLFMKYNIELELDKKSKLILSHETMFSYNFKPFIMDILLALIHPNYLLDGYTVTIPAKINIISANYEINDLLVVFTLTRLHIFYKMIFTISIYNSSRSRRVLIMKGYDEEDIFAMKCFINKYIYYVISITVLLFMIVFSITFQILEAHYNKSDNTCNSTSAFVYFNNCVWIISISMATIGYGEMFASTTLGRMMCLLSVFTGTIQLSLLYYSFTDFFNLDKKRNEKKAYVEMHKLEEKKHIEKKFAELFRTVHEYNKIKREYCINKRVKDQIDNKTSIIRTLKAEMKKLLMKKLQIRNKTKQLLQHFNNIFHSNPSYEALGSKIEKSLKKDNIIKTLSSQNKKIYNKISRVVDKLKTKSEEIADALA